MAAVRSLVPEARPALRHNLAAAAHVRPGEVDYIKNRKPSQIPKRRADGVDPREDERNVRSDQPMRGVVRDDNLPDGPEGPSTAGTSSPTN
jgi:hypothetical protein